MYLKIQMNFVPDMCRHSVFFFFCFTTSGALAKIEQFVSKRAFRLFQATPQLKLTVKLNTKTENDTAIRPLSKALLLTRVAGVLCALKTT